MGNLGKGFEDEMSEQLRIALDILALLAVTFLVSAVTLGTGRTYVMQGAVHLVLFAAFLFLAFAP